MKYLLLTLAVSLLSGCGGGGGAVAPIIPTAAPLPAQTQRSPEVANSPAVASSPAPLILQSGTYWGTWEISSEKGNIHMSGGCEVEIGTDRRWSANLQGSKSLLLEGHIGDGQFDCDIASTDAPMHCTGTFNGPLDQYQTITGAGPITVDGIAATFSFVIHK